MADMKSSWKSKDLVDRIMKIHSDLVSADGGIAHELYPQIKTQARKNLTALVRGTFGDNGSIGFDDLDKQKQFFETAATKLADTLNATTEPDLKQRHADAAGEVLAELKDKASHYKGLKADGSPESDFKDADATAHANWDTHWAATIAKDVVKGHNDIRLEHKKVSDEIANTIQSLADADSDLDIDVRYDLDAYVNNLPKALAHAFSKHEGKGYKFDLSRAEIIEIAQAGLDKIKDQGREGIDLQIEALRETIQKLVETGPHHGKNNRVNHIPAGRYDTFAEVVTEPEGKTVEGQTEIVNAIAKQIKYGKLSGVKESQSTDLLDRASREFQQFMDHVSLSGDYKMSYKEIRQVATMVRSMIEKDDLRKGAEYRIDKQVDKFAAAAKAMVDAQKMPKEEQAEEYDAILSTAIERAPKLGRKYGYALADSSHEDHDKAYDALKKDFDKLPNSSKFSSKTGAVEQAKEKGQGIMNSKTAIGVTIGAAIIGGLVAFSEKVQKTKVQKTIGKWTSYILGAGILGAGIYGASRIANNSGNSNGRG